MRFEVLVATAVACTGASGCGSSTPTTRSVSAAGASSLRAAAPPCRSGAISISLRKPISPMTGEHGRVFVLTNRSRGTCRLLGSPRIGLYRHGRRMAFAVRYTAGRSGEFYTSNRTPHPVPLRAGSAAYFAVLKYRCDAGVLGEAAELRVSLPGAAMNLRVALPPGGGGFGVSAIDYCKSSTGDAAPDPGNRVDVSAITESAGAAFAPVDSE